MKHTAKKPLPVARDYQLASIEAHRDGFRDGHVRQILSASTGAGKSIIMLLMIHLAQQRNTRTIFICERRILVEQFSAHLDAYGIDHGVIMAGHWRFRLGEKIQVASVQTLEKMEALPMFDFAFIDEIHACMRASIIKMFETRPNMKVIGATATPFNPKLPKYFSKIVNVITMRELVNDGHLVPFKVFAAQEIDTGGLKKNTKGEFEVESLGVRAKDVIGDCVSEYIRLSMDIYGELRKGIVFSAGIAHGAELARRFTEAGIVAMQVSSEDTPEYRSEVMAEFSKADSRIKLLISAEVLQRGFDQPDIDFVILAKVIVKDFSGFVQSIGRGARPYHNKEFCVIQDHGNNCLRFADDWNKLYSEGMKEFPENLDDKERKEPTKKEKEAAKCPSCGAVNSGSPCSHCGHVREVKSTVVEVAGAMSELNGFGDGAPAKKEKYTGEYKESFYQQLLAYAHTKNYSEGWAFYKYKDKFGIQPAWKKTPAAFVGDEVRGWITSQNIRKAKGRANG